MQGFRSFTKHAAIAAILSASPVLLAQKPVVADGGLVNAASFAKNGAAGAPTAPGSLVAIFGTFGASTVATADTVPFSTSLGGVGVTVNGVAAPIVSVTFTGAFPFVSAQMPVETPTSGTVQVAVSVNGVSSDPKPMPVTASAPGIFTIPPDGQSNAILVFVDSDGTAKIAAPTNANIGYPTAPIKRGTNAFFYATGLGTLSPPVSNGDGPSDKAYNAVNPIHVFIGSGAGQVEANVQFAGQAPFFPGVNQINIQIPQNAPTGDGIPLVIKTQDLSFSSNTAKISIQ